jgi:hypothetical protein
MNVIFHLPGSVSSMWPAGDTSPLHDYIEGNGAGPCSDDVSFALKS